MTMPPEDRLCTAALTTQSTHPDQNTGHKLGNMLLVQPGPVL